MSGPRSYVTGITGKLAASLPDCPDDLLRMYALLALVSGPGTTLEDVHDAWACWRVATRPDHPALVPFTDLTPDVQELDQKYADAIRTVAAEYAATRREPQS